MKLKQSVGKNNETESEKEPTNSEQLRRKDIYEWIQSLIVALAICITVFIFFVRVVDVSGSFHVADPDRRR